MSSSPTLLIEVGTEELPPKALQSLSEAFAKGIQDGLSEAKLSFAKSCVFATPRRLCLRVEELQAKQNDEVVRRRGPSLKVAFDASGEPTKAALGFAKSCGVPFDQLGRETSDKGEFLSFESTQPGQATPDLLQQIVQASLDGLPIPKRMRWGDGDAEFVRPVHWILALFGPDIVPLKLFGLEASNQTRGHRFHSPAEITVSETSAYESQLQANFVVADFATRRHTIVDQVSAVATELNGVVVHDDELFDEVTALVEWPVAVTGSFDQRFLKLPKEVLISTLKDHQRYFPVETPQGDLTQHFITISNIESDQPEMVSAGNERVVRPRLEDAEFFFQKDRQTPLSDRVVQLDKVTFQNKLGSVGDKVTRVGQLANSMATELGQDTASVARAAMLCKCDLVTDMVGEFPELQGVMGRYYAELDGEPGEVCSVIEQHYRPRFAGDELPDTPPGQIVSMADKLDTIAGIFAIGQPPTGTKDPFGLRRSALGILRILIEGRIGLDLWELVSAAVKAQPVSCDEDEVTQQVFGYLMDRLRGYYSDQGNLSSEMFTSVLATKPRRPLDFHQRLLGVEAFLPLPEAPSLIAANKRIANILKKESHVNDVNIDEQKFSQEEEKTLFLALRKLQQVLPPLTDDGLYKEALIELAQLKQPVDEFFDGVMVMDDDPSIKQNRIALLIQVRELFLNIADVQHLQGA
ncbi:MAG: glycine--tRNA ligase subunit beta [Pseudomonadota bacterium]